MRNYGLKALLCMRLAFPYIMHEPEINLGGAVRKEHKGQVSFELCRRCREPLLLRCLRSLKGESTFSGSINLAITR